MNTTPASDKNTEDVYRAVFENTGTGTIIIDEDMTILHGNVTLEGTQGRHTPSMISPGRLRPLRRK